MPTIEQFVRYYTEFALKHGVAMRKTQKMELRILIGTFCWALVLNTNHALAICFPPKATPEDPFQFMMALTESLSYAKSALAKGSRDTTDLTEMIYQVKSAEEDYKCAADFMGAYTKSKDQLIAGSAEVARNTFNGLINLDEQLIALIKSVLDAGRQSQFSQGEFAEKLAEVRIGVDEIWKVLPGATALATHALEVIS